MRALGNSAQRRKLLAPFEVAKRKHPGAQGARVGVAQNCRLSRPTTFVKSSKTLPGVPPPSGMQRVPPRHMEQHAGPGANPITNHHFGPLSAFDRQTCFGSACQTCTTRVAAARCTTCRVSPASLYLVPPGSSKVQRFLSYSIATADLHAAALQDEPSHTLTPDR